MAALDWSNGMRRLVWLAAALMMGGAVAAVAQGENAAQDDTAAMMAVMSRSAADWNRGDMDRFVTCYKDSPDILVVGSESSVGYGAMVAIYKKYYGTPEKMGVLTYSALAVQPLDARFATMTGHFHLERTAAGGGNADGYYLLVWEKTKAGWKIVRDDSTVVKAGG